MADILDTRNSKRPWLIGVWQNASSKRTRGKLREAGHGGSELDGKDVRLGYAPEQWSLGSAASYSSNVQQRVFQSESVDWAGRLQEEKEPKAASGTTS